MKLNLIKLLTNNCICIFFFDICNIEHFGAPLIHDCVNPLMTVMPFSLFNILCHSLCIYFCYKLPLPLM